MIRLLESGCTVIDNPYKRKLTKNESIELLSDGMTGLIAGLEPLDRDVLRHSSLKVISRCGIGLDNINLTAAKELGIVVRNTPDAPTISVAELTIGALLSLLRDIPLANQDIHHKNWTERTGVQLSGKTVLIIGFGRIGRYLTKLLKPFDVTLLAVDPALSGRVDGVTIVTLQEGLPQADIICLHLSGSEQVIGKEEFSIMKQGVYILNATRGGIVNEDDLIEALKSKKIRGAWLDVFSQEPYSGPLIEFPQVILTPHAGSYTQEARVRMERETVDNLLAELK